MPPYANMPASLINPTLPISNASGTTPNTGVLGSFLSGTGGLGAAPVYAGTNQGQVLGAYGGTQGSLEQQQAFLKALQGANGVGNLSSVFGQMGQTGNMLQQEALGGGPNPAARMLAEQTGQNVNAQAALMAGQRGVSQDPGLFARNIARQGAATQQQATGQGALMGAQQQLTAQQQLQQNQANMAAVAQGQVGSQATGTTANTSANQNELSTLLAGLNNYNNSNVAMQGNLNTANAGITSSQNQAVGQGFGGLLSGIGAGLAAIFNQGGVVPTGDGVTRYAQGGKIPAPALPGSSPAETDVLLDSYARGSLPGKVQFSGPDYIEVNAPQGLQRFDRRTASPEVSAAFPQTSGPQPSGYSKGGPVSFMGRFHGANPKLQQAHSSLPPSRPVNFTSGGVAPGRAAVAGDSPENDTVHALVSPGELVVKRSAMQSPEKMAAFIRATTGFNLVPARS